jgi:hypothetical protein
MARLFDSRTVEDAVEITERRVALLESQIEVLEQHVQDLRDGRDFDDQLRGPAPADRIGPGTPDP